MSYSQVKIDRNNTIQTREELVIGMPLWIVGQGGITQIEEPQFVGFLASFAYSRMGDEFTSFEEHPDYITIISLFASKPGIDDVIAAMQNMNIPPNGYFVVDSAKAPKDCYFGNMSLNDKNVDGGGYNNWYLCKSEKDAMEVYKELCENWTQENEQERAQFRQRCKSLFC